MYSTNQFHTSEPSINQIYSCNYSVLVFPYIVLLWYRIRVFGKTEETFRTLFDFICHYQRALVVEIDRHSVKEHSDDIFYEDMNVLSW